MDKMKSDKLAEELAKEVREHGKDPLPEEMTEDDARPWGPSDHDAAGGVGLEPGPDDEVIGGGPSGPDDDPIGESGFPDDPGFDPEKQGSRD
jgi:hypothetical protein